jgi:hypothetical protein
LKGVDEHAGGRPVADKGVSLGRAEQTRLRDTTDRID